MIIYHFPANILLILCLTISNLMVWLLEFVAPYTEPNMIPEFNSTCVTLNLGEPTKKNGEILYYKVHLP